MDKQKFRLQVVRTECAESRKHRIIKTFFSNTKPISARILPVAGKLKLPVDDPEQYLLA